MDNQKFNNSVKSLVFALFFVISGMQIGFAQTRVIASTGIKFDRAYTSSELLESPYSSGYPSFNLGVQRFIGRNTAVGLNLSQMYLGMVVAATGKGWASILTIESYVKLGVDYSVFLPINRRLRLIPQAGFSVMHLASNDAYSSVGRFGGGSVSVRNGVADTAIYRGEYSTLHRNSFLIDFGLMIEWRIVSNLSVVTGPVRHIGFTKILRNDLVYTHNSDPKHYTVMYSNGSYFEWVLGLSYQINRRRVPKKFEKGNRNS